MIRIKPKIILFLSLLVIFLGTALVFQRHSYSQLVNLKPPAAVVPAKFFGMHIIFAAKKHPDMPTTTPWPSVPFASWRLWGALVEWPLLEPKKGEWHFETLDKTLDLAEQNHVEVLLTLGQSPPWASARPTEPGYVRGWAAEPRNIEDWRNYVRTVATRYKGRIRYYEIWNEPNWYRFYTGSLEDMLKLTREAYRVLKQVDPSILVVSPSPTDDDKGVSWLKEYLKKGGGNFVDIIGFHFYLVPQPPEGMVPLIGQVQQVMAQYKVSNKPLWNTEAGWLGKEPFSAEKSAAYVARTYILNWAANVGRFYWYAWDNQGVSLTMTEADIKTPTSAAIAYTQVQKWLVGARMTSCTQNQKTWTCQLNRQGGYHAWIVWNPARKLRFQIPASWGVQQVRELTGVQRPLSATGNHNSPVSVEIGPSPLLLERLTQ